MLSSMSQFSIGDRVIAVGVDSPATGVVVGTRDGGRYEVEWQTDYLTEVVEAEEIVSSSEE